MKIIKVEENKNKYIKLLLEADPEEKIVEKYLIKGDLYVGIKDDITVCVCVVVQYDDTTCELKNIATLPEARGNGYAAKMINYVFEEYKNRYEKMIVGTTENMIPFYVLNGFNRYHHTVKNFFIDNYKEEIWDGNMQCIDMYYYSKTL